MGLISGLSKNKLIIVYILLALLFLILFAMFYFIVRELKEGKKGKIYVAYAKVMEKNQILHNSVYSTGNNVGSSIGANCYILFQTDEGKRVNCKVSEQFYGKYIVGDYGLLKYKVTNGYGTILKSFQITR